MKSIPHDILFISEHSSHIKWPFLQVLDFLYFLQRSQVTKILSQMGQEVLLKKSEHVSQ
jgi:hypothetical protein